MIDFIAYGMKSIIWILLIKQIKHPITQNINGFLFYELEIIENGGVIVKIY